MRPGTRAIVADVVTGSLLVAVVYATPARLRPALGLALAVALSRQHGAAHRRDLVRLFDERVSVTRHLEYTVDPELDEHGRRLEDLEALVLVLGDGAISPGGFADRALERVRSRFMTTSGRTP